MFVYVHQPCDFPHLKSVIAFAQFFEAMVLNSMSSLDIETFNQLAYLLQYFLVYFPFNLIMTFYT